MPSHIVVEKERLVRIDAELWRTSECLLNAGQERERGCTHQFRASLIFTAFAFEAYLNHIGPGVFASWPEIERKLSPHEKLSLLCEQLAVTVDWSSRPWQSIKALMGYRNTVAHGRGEQLKESYKENAEHYHRRFYEIPLTDWEEYGSKENAERAREDVLKVTELIQAKTGSLDHLPFFPGSLSGSATYVSEG
jgi:hypothetical protein